MNHERELGQGQLGDKAFQRIYADILAGVLPPGEQVTELTLAHRYDFTRAPVRNALVRLSQEGWISPMPRKGYVIKPLSLRDVREVFDLRRQLEPEATRRAAGRIDQELLSRLNEETSIPYDLQDQSGEDRFFAANLAFHQNIAIAAGNHRIAILVRQLHEESQRILRVGMRFANWSVIWQHGHAEMLAALVAGNGERAGEIALRQLDYSERIVMDALSDKLSHIPLYTEK